MKLTGLLQKTVFTLLGARIPATLFHETIKKNGYLGGQEMAFLLLEAGADIMQVIIQDF